MAIEQEWQERPEGCPQYYDKDKPVCQSCQMTDKCLQDMFKTFMGEMGREMQKSKQNQGLSSAYVSPFKPKRMDDPKYIDKFIDIYDMLKKRAENRGISWEPIETANLMMAYLINFHNLSMEHISGPIQMDSEMTFDEFIKATGGFDAEAADNLKKAIEEGKQIPKEEKEDGTNKS